jgi:TRAP transporter TAXI family solute receptor
MSQRLAALIALFAFAVLVVTALVTGGNLGMAGASAGRISFQIATGSTEGIYFPVGQAMAGLISHPPGVGRCETATVCGPSNVILSARTSEGAADNLRSVNQGLVDSGLAQGDVIAAAVAGEGAFRRSGKLSHLRVIAALFNEEAQLVVAADSKIKTVQDLRGKRVMLGAENSGGLERARKILTAFHVPWWRVRAISPDKGAPAQLLREGKLDAYFVVTGVPLASIADLIRDHKARLVPIDGEGRDRLIKVLPQLVPAVIRAGAYPGQDAVETVAARAWWVTRDSESDALIYGITRALFNPANRGQLAASHPAARDISLAYATDSPPAPIHPGAARFYREMGKLPR